MKRLAVYLLTVTAGLMMVFGVAYSDTTVGRKPAAQAQATPAPKPGSAPAPSVLTPKPHIPVCGMDAPPGPSAARGPAAARDATTLKMGHGIGAVGGKSVLRAKLTRSKDGAAVANHTVSFSVEGKPAGTAKTDGSGEASLQFAVPAQVGNHGIGASYRGSDFCAPSSGKETLAVIKSATKFTLNPMYSHKTLREGEGDTLKGRLFRITDDQGLDGREVNLALDGKPMGTAATDPSGNFSKSYSMPPPSAGMHTIEAKYEGEALYLGSVGTSKFEVLPKVQKAYLTWNGASGKVGQTATVTARLGLGNPPSAKNAIPGKTIDFRGTGPGNINYVRVLGEAVTDSQGIATVSFKIEDPAGNYDMSTQAHVSKFTDYDVQYMSPKPKYTVSKAPVTISVIGPGAAPIGANVTFTASVRRSTDNGPAAGVKVTMKFPTDTLGKSATTDAGGKATFQITVPYAYGTGTKTLTFTADESKQYVGGTSASKAFTIQPKTN